jgi:hypothetical protein
MSSPRADRWPALSDRVSANTAQNEPDQTYDHQGQTNQQQRRPPVFRLWIPLAAVAHCHHSAQSSISNLT